MSRRAVLVTGLGTLVVALACTVGEARPEGPGAPAPTTEVEDTAGAGEPGVGVGADEVGEYRATDLLIRSQLAYERAALEESLALAEQVLMEHPGSMAVEPARWVGARAAFSLGRYQRARDMAETYADGQPRESEVGDRARDLVELAEDALAPPSGPPPVVGVILPRNGPRVLVRYADWLLEGIQLAITEAEQHQGRRIDLVVADDSGGARTAEAVQELERQGALAIIGPLMPRQLPVAASARRDPRRVMVSPTAQTSPTWSETYSVRAGDTRGAQELGQFAADVGLRQAAVLHARGQDYERKARGFAVEYEALGGDVRAVVPYDSGTTTFGPHMSAILQAVAPGGMMPLDGFVIDSLVAMGLLPDRAAADTMPQDTLLMMARVLRREAGAGQPQEPFALYVAAPAQDVPKIAPQVAFYDLDSAGVQILGDEAWASAEVRRVVPGRDLEGVIASSSFPPERATAEADPGFIERYEARYRRSLDNPLPALGYDAANLVLQALPNRLLTPDALARRFRFLAGIRGATGVLSVRGGQLVRTPYLVVIRDGRLKPAPRPWEYELPVPLPPSPETEGGSRR